MSESQKIVFEMDEPGKHFSIVLSNQMQTIYADGIASLLGGPSISKIQFFVTEELTPLSSGEMKETRVVKLTVVVPTLQLLQGLTNVISQAGGFGAALEAGLGKTMEDTSKIIAKCKEMADVKIDIQ